MPSLRLINIVCYECEILPFLSAFRKREIALKACCSFWHPVRLEISAFQRARAYLPIAGSGRGTNGKSSLTKVYIQANEAKALIEISLRQSHCITKYSNTITRYKCNHRIL